MFIPKRCWNIQPNEVVLAENENFSTSQNVCVNLNDGNEWKQAEGVLILKGFSVRDL